MHTLETSESATASEQPGPGNATNSLDRAEHVKPGAHISATHVSDLRSKEDGSRQPALASHLQT